MVLILPAPLSQILKAIGSRSTSSGSTGSTRSRRSSSSLISTSSLEQLEGNERTEGLLPKNCNSEGDLSPCKKTLLENLSLPQLAPGNVSGYCSKETLVIELDPSLPLPLRNDEYNLTLRIAGPSLTKNRLQGFVSRNKNLLIRSRSVEDPAAGMSFNMKGDHEDQSDDSGISTMYTSTPTKNSNNFLESTDSNENNSLEAQPGLTLVQTSTSKLTTISSPYDDSLAKILESGDEEFRSKYSSWVAELFHLQLTKMHRRLTHYFQKKLQTLDQERQDQLQASQQLDQGKLLTLEAKAEKYRNAAEALRDENRKLKGTVDAIVEEMGKISEQARSTVQTELDRYAETVKAECEGEKLKLQQQHAHQLKIFLDRSCQQIEKVEGEYQAQIGSLNQTLQNLRRQNESLEEQVKTQKRIEAGGPYSLRPPLTSGSYCFQKEKEHLLSIIQDLKSKLYAAEREKLSISTNYGERIEVLNFTIASLEKTFLEKLENSQKDLTQLQVSKDQEIHLLKTQLAKQAEESQRIIDSLRNNYGAKIQSLSEMVERLQIDIDEQNSER